MPLRLFNELVPSFLRLKKVVVECCEGDPSVLYEDAKKDEKLRKYCVDLNHIAKELREHEVSAEEGLLAPVNSSFREEWNDYVKNWKRQVSLVWIYDDWAEMADLFAGVKIESVYADGSENDISKYEEQDFTTRIRALKDARMLIDEGSDECSTLDDQIDSLTTLWKTTRFSLGGSVERADLTPVALVPPKIANKITPGGRLSLFRFWNEARRAYILGAPMASMAMARATLEILLRDVHKAEGESLEGHIQYMKKNDRLSGDVMHRVQKVGDTILHGLRDTSSIPGRKASENPALASLQVLRDLKALIETS